jgi:predicted nucleotide-binding protein
MSIELLQSSYDKVNYLVNLLMARATGSNASSEEFVVLRSELFQDTDISHLLPGWLRQQRDLDTFWEFIKNKFSKYSDRRNFISSEFTPVLDFLEFGVLHKNKEANKNELVEGVVKLQENIITRNKRKVFIVHGRDNEVKQEVSRFIEKIGLEAIILHEKASSGRTIIEKIEYYSNDVDFAIVLYTACDRGLGNHENGSKPRSRARQNVVFEHGYLMAKLGRENVCSLVKGDVETPNDIGGVVYVPFDVSGGWKQDICRELKSCGYGIKNIF